MIDFDPIITSEDLHEFVKSQDDFGLELFVYSAARDLGFDAMHGGTYVDHLTNKRRQFDVQASMLIDSTTDPCIVTPFQIFLAIECKCLKPTYPLLVSRIPRLAGESFHNRIVAPGTRQEEHYTTGTSIRYGHATVESVQGVKSLYVPNAYVGKSTAQVGKTYLPATKKGVEARVEYRGSDGDVHDKWTQALGSAGQIVQNIATTSLPADADLRCIVLPVLVVSNGTLWAADYSENGSLQGPPTCVDEVELFVNERYQLPGSHEFAISHLHIMTRDGVVNFMRKLATDVPFRRRVAEIRRVESSSFARGYA